MSKLPILKEANLAILIYFIRGFNAGKN